MRRLSWRMFGMALTVLSLFVADASAEYKLSGDNTKIEFEGTKKDGKHTGSFPKLSGTLDLGDDPTKAKISVKIDMEALTSDNDMLTNHLKAPDFFETKKYPEAKFVSKSIKASKKGKDDYLVTGELTMHGKTKEISFPAKISKADGAATLTSEFKINRGDWGITYGEGKIDEAVKLTVSVKAN